MREGSPPGGCATVGLGAGGTGVSPGTAEKAAAHVLQQAVAGGRADLYARFAELVNGRPTTELHDLLDFVPAGPPVPHATEEEVDRFARAAQGAAPAFAALPLTQRAGILRAAAAAIEAHRDELVALADSETGGLLQPEELQTWRLLHAAPQPYTRERFDDTYNWTVKWNMTVPGATYENTVDNRAWQ